jgi:hypothetical protein
MTEQLQFFESQRKARAIRRRQEYERAVAVKATEHAVSKASCLLSTFRVDVLTNESRTYIFDNWRICSGLGRGAGRLP